MYRKAISRLCCSLKTRQTLDEKILNVISLVQSFATFSSPIELFLVSLDGFAEIMRELDINIADCLGQSVDMSYQLCWIWSRQRKEIGNLRLSCGRHESPRSKAANWQAMRAK